MPTSGASSHPSVAWDHYRAALFDLDGVLTPSAELHKTAWTSMFDEFLSHREGQSPFTERDYLRYVDGKPRVEGIASFLDSRGIHLARDRSSDPGADTIESLGDTKNARFMQLLRERGIAPYPGSLQLLDVLERRHLAMAVVTSSKNAQEVLEAAGLAGRFAVVIDGLVAAERRLSGKPAPDTFIAAADALHVTVADCVVFEDAVAGVQAGRAGQFGLVIGVDRGAGREALRSGGADLVVDDLGDLARSASVGGTSGDCSEDHR